MFFQFLQLHNVITKLHILVHIDLHCFFVNGWHFSWAETASGTVSVLTSFESWIPNTDKDAFWPWSWSLDTTDLLTNEIEDPELLIASTFRLKSLLVRLIRTAGSPPWAMLVATVVASETFFVVSFFGKSLCNSLLCRLPQLDTLHVLLLQSYDMWSGVKQLKYSRNFWTCSRCPFTFNDLNFSRVQIGWCPSLKGLSRFFSLFDSSVFEAKAIRSSQELLLWRQAILW